MTTAAPNEAVPEPASSSRLPAAHKKIVVTLLIAAFVVILNETIMGVALPKLMVELEVTPSTVQWLSTAFMLTMAVVIPTTGFLLQRLTTRTVFVLAMSLFSVGTLLAAIAPSFWPLLFGRIVQASGTAIMIPLLMTTILTLVPVEHRGVVMGNVSIAISVAPAIGPTISGIILQYLSWRFMFVLVLPIAITALVYGAKQLVNVGEQGHQRLDVISVILSVPAFGGIVFGLSRIGEIGESGLALALVPLLVGIVCLVAFGARQIRLQRSGNPLLDLRVFRFGMFRLSVSMMVIAMIALFGMIILLPIYLQSVRGIDSLQTGLMLLPGGLLMGLLAPTVGKLFDRYGPRALTLTGTIVMVLVMFGFSRVDPTTPIWWLMALHISLSLGLACLFTPAFTSALNPLPPHLYSHGSATLTTLQQVAGAAGTALLIAIMAGRTLSLTSQGVGQLEATGQGLNTSFAVAGGIGIVAIVLAAFMRKQEMPAGGAHGGAAEDGVGAEEAGAELR